jgi:hypothetical protein
MFRQYFHKTLSYLGLLPPAIPSQRDRACSQGCAARAPGKRQASACRGGPNAVKAQLPLWR